MSKPTRDELVTSLNTDPDPKVRRKACKKLANSRDPEVIPFLAQAYNADQDEQVKATAREALATFKTQQVGRNRRQLPVSDRLLTRVLGVLTVLLVISLVLHGVRWIQNNREDDTDDTPSSLFGQEPTSRDMVLDQIQEKQTQALGLTTNLKNEITNHSLTGQLSCEAIYTIPPSLVLAEIDQYTYPDLRVVGEKLNTVLPSLELALTTLNSACSDPATQMQKVVQASEKLGQIDVQLAEVDQLLQNAITNPAPTVGPTITPVPTVTMVSTVIPTTVPNSTDMPVSLTAATVAPMVTPTTTAIYTPALTSNPAPTSTPPRPNLDYTQVLRTLSRKYSILSSLQTMHDQWQNVQSGGQHPSSCILPQWPEPMMWSEEQLAQLNVIGVSDQELIEAVQLQKEGFELAEQARLLYERDCPAQLMINSMDEGLRITQEATEKFLQSKARADEIRARPTE